MSLAAASKHIKSLERAGLVRRQVQGRTHLCRLAPEALAGADQWLGFYRRLWSDSFDALDTLIKSDQPAPGARRQSVSEDHKLRMTRRFDASPQRLFEAWTDPKMAAAWLFTAPTSAKPIMRSSMVRAGGKWEITDRRGGVLPTAPSANTWRSSRRRVWSSPSACRSSARASTR